MFPLFYMLFGNIIRLFPRQTQSKNKSSDFILIVIQFIFHWSFISWKSDQKRFVKMFIYRRKYLAMKKIALMIQTAGRRHLAMKKAQGLRNTRAATKIQSWWRMVRARRRYIRLQRGIMLIQVSLKSSVSTFILERFHTRVSHTNVYMWTFLQTWPFFRFLIELVRFYVR